MVGCCYEHFYRLSAVLISRARGARPTKQKPICLDEQGCQAASRVRPVRETLVALPRRQRSLREPGNPVTWCGGKSAQAASTAMSATANMAKSRSVNAFIACGSARSINQSPRHRHGRVKDQRAENCRTWRLDHVG